jgi:hypothetical protein
MINAKGAIHNLLVNTWLSTAVVREMLPTYRNAAALGQAIRQWFGVAGIS